MMRDVEMLSIHMDMKPDATINDIIILLGSEPIKAMMFSAILVCRSNFSAPFANMPIKQGKLSSFCLR